ncbi:hypothetical protein N9V74_04830 [Alteromonas sp.]|jgi:type IV fimbrial biogenesis protein FimT|nr:hypothetical protein [Alteromonas sp.]
MVLNLNKGLSLLETMVFIVIMAIVIAQGVPSFIQWKKQEALVTSLNKVTALLKHGRQYALSHRGSVNIIVQSGANSCMGITTLATCNCTVVNSCQNQSNRSSINLSPLNTEIMLSGGTKKIITFDGTHGMSFNSATSVTIRNSLYTGKVIVSNTGRARACVSSSLPGLPLC